MLVALIKKLLSKISKATKVKPKGMFGDKRIIIVRGGVKSDEAVIFPSDFAQAMSELYSLAACERKEALGGRIQLPDECVA